MAALLLAGCGNGGEEERPAGPPLPKHDLKPHWEVGQVFEIREEQHHREGLGKVPPAREVDGRSRVRRDLTDVYREEILAAEGSRLIRTRRTYLKSEVSENGSPAKSPVAGKTYEIKNPFGEQQVQVVLEDGTKEDASRKETQHIARATLNMAATMIPADPVAEGDTWVPRRNRDAFSPIGSGQLLMSCSLARLGAAGGRRTADLEGITEATVRREEGIGLHVSIKEKMRLDLDNRTFASHSSVAELFYPPPLNPKGRWSRTVSSLTVTPR